LLASERADDVASAGAEHDPQAIFEYLYHHVIPAPRTVFKGVFRLLAGHCGVFERGSLKVEAWWQPKFEENRRAPFSVLKAEFRQLLREAVESQVDDGVTGCFLSGGTDSSTVAGLLSQILGGPVPAFSIGFDAAGYDEMEYARLAARHFNVKHHEYYVTPNDLVKSIPAVAASYDQPFGNSSVVPAYYCAKAAKEAGLTRILAGDGGDELFGGNVRYAKQRIFGYYDAIPAAVRHGVLEPLLTEASLAARVPGLKKAVSYIEQAKVPMPDRMQMYNLLARLGVGNVLTKEFLEQVSIDAVRDQQRQVYASANCNTQINRMLWLDWKYTLADNDLPKVLGATGLAGLPVGFPLLDDRLTDFSLKLEPEFKLKGLTLRWFFKEALKDFLPPEIISKKKHGFGLPFGVWVVQQPALRKLAQESIASLRGRGIVKAEFLDKLVSEYLPQHPGYYGEMVWVLMMLGQWLGRPSRPASSSPVV
jgi:asparagine synthase (glutamine-hydrolysing)